MNIFKMITNPKAYVLKAKVRIINKIRSVFFKGDKVLCDICSWKGARFFDGHCPKCNSLPRTRLIPFALKHFKLTKNTSKVLHIAPNLNEYHYFKNNVTNISNYDRLNIKQKPQINIIQDLTNTSLDSLQYDLAVAWHVLEHITEDVKAISEVYRLLKPGGKFLVSVPIFPIGNFKTFEDASIAYEDYERIHGHYDHCRSCGLDYFQRFKSVGFQSDELLIKDVNKKDINFYGLRTDHVVWCFTK